MDECMDELTNRNRNINRGFRKLTVWQEAIDFYVFVSKKIDTLKIISFKVKGQIDDSAFSVHSNIAEGYARRSLKDNINFNNYALASLAENYSQVYALLKTEIIDKTWFNQYDTKHYSLENKLISYNKSQVKKLKDKDNWNNDYILREGIEKYGDEE
jgi:four helix bundle protein